MFKVYAYTKQVNPITLQDTIDLNPNITIALNNIESTNTSVSTSFKDTLPVDQEAILSGLVNDHIYTEIVEENETSLLDGEGKLIVHPTIKPAGFQTYFTGAGDNPTDYTDVGNGQHLHIYHKIGDPLSGIVIADFNSMDNPTYVYEGYISWNGVKLVELDVEIITRATEFEMVSGGTGFDLYGGYLIVPSANGTVNVLSDITQNNGGLVKMPLNEDGTTNTAYWDADWDSSTGLFSNIRPNMTGEGEFNLFAGEIPLVRFVNNYILTGLGSQELDSEDSDEMGHGMRLLVRWVQHADVEDTEWVVGTTITMHRLKTV
jgi:hypothetical protein